MHELLPGLYDRIEPIALNIAEQAAALRPTCPQTTYLVEVSRRIVAHGRYRREAGSAETEALQGTLAWYRLLGTHLPDFVAGQIGAADIIKLAGGRLWTALQADETPCAVYAHGVVRALGDSLAGKRVLELGAGTGGTTRRLRTQLRACERFVLTDVRAKFLSRIASDLAEVPVDTQTLDIDDLSEAPANFDVIYATNTLHVARDIPATLRGLRRLLVPGGLLVLGEGSHYSNLAPSPLSLILSLFHGWWDAPTSASRPEPGFLSRQHWLDALDDAGYDHASGETWSDVRREYGGVYKAFAS